MFLRPCYIYLVLVICPEVVLSEPIVCGSPRHLCADYFFWLKTSIYGANSPVASDFGCSIEFVSVVVNPFLPTIVSPGRVL